MTAPSMSNRLTVLGHEIRAAHADIQRSAEAMAERALTAGAALLEAKGSIQHGRWKSWLYSNTGLSERTAQRYMQLAQSGLESATVADLGIRGAASALSRRRDKQPLADDSGYPEWRDEMVRLLDEADQKHPGARAAFITWARSQTATEKYVEILMRTCPEEERPSLEAMIEVQQARSFMQAFREAQS